MGAYPSRFLADIPPSLLEEKVTRPSWGMAREPTYRPMRRSPPTPSAPSSADPLMSDIDDAYPDVSDDAPRYVKGERVKHRRFGSGTIRDVAGRGKDLKVQVEFDDETVGLKQLLAAYAGLEREWESA